MKSLILPLLLSLLSLVAWAEEKKQPDLIRVVVKEQGIDTVFTQVVLVPENLYTDSLIVGVKKTADGPLVYLANQAHVEYFRLNGTMFEPRMLQLEDGTEHRLLMERDRGTKGSNALIYALGQGSQRRYYMRTRLDNTLHPLATADRHLSAYALHYLNGLWREPSDQAAAYLTKTRATQDHFRLAERVCRQHNDHYLRRFTWGVLAGVHRSDLTTVQQGEQLGQLCATAGLWADLPIDTWGTSLRAEVNYYAQSAHLEASSIQAAYNYRGLEVPLLLRYTVLPVRGSVLPYIEGGAALAVTLSSNLEQERKNSDDDGDFYFTSQGKLISEMPVSILFGAGVEWQLHPKHSLWLGLRYRLPSVLEEYRGMRPETGELEDISMKLKRSGLTLTLMYNL